MTRPIRVLHTLPDLQVGGGQRLLLGHILGMEPGRAEHHVACVRSVGGMEAEFEPSGAVLHWLGLRGREEVPGAVGRLSRLARDLGVDLIHTNNTLLDRLVGFLAAIRLRLPVVNTLHSEFQEIPRLATGGMGALRRRVSRFTSRWLARRCVVHAVAVSRRVARTWAPYLGSLGLRPDRVSVIPPGLDLARFARGIDPPSAVELRRSLGTVVGDPVLLNVARLVPGKGQRSLLPTLKEVRRRSPGARLLLAGEGPGRGLLEGWIREAGLEPAVRLLGNRSDVPDLLRVADLALFPSESEGFGIAMLEAMAAGTAVVAWRLPAYADFVEEGANAVLVEPGDVAGFTEAVLRLLEDPCRRRALGEAGRRTAARFSREASSRALLEVYLRTLEGRSPPARLQEGSGGVPAELGGWAVPAPGRGPSVPVLAWAPAPPVGFPAAGPS